MHRRRYRSHLYHRYPILLKRRVPLPLRRQFSIKEIDIGMAADLGTLQIFPKRVGNESTFRELAYTGRNMAADEALKIGLVSRVFEDRAQL